MEYFDVLDENGYKTGKTKLRQDVHRDGDWHRGISVYIVNSKGDVLLQKRSQNVDKYPNMWNVSSGGHVDAGEDSITTAIREVKEELGVDITEEQLELLYTTKSSYIPKPGFIENEIIDVYLVKADIKVEDVILQKEEVSDVKYIAIKEFRDMIERRDKDLIIYPDMNRLILALEEKI